MSIPAPYSEVYLAGDGTTTVFAFGTNFKPISAGLVKCSVYLQDGYEVIPTYTVDMEGKFITISALTLPDSTVLTAPPSGSTVRIYRDMPEEQDITASQLQAFTAKQLEIALDAIVAMIQEVSYTTDHKTVRLTEPQRDIALQELGALEDEHLIYWDNTARKLVVTNYPQKDVVRCVNGLFFRLRTDPDTQEPYLQWSTDESDWHSINIDEVELQAQGAYALAGDAYTLAYATRGELNTHKADHSNPHETSLANLIDTNVAGATGGQFLQYNGINWVPVSSSATVYWGGILGNITDQADLKTALDGKVGKAGDTMTGALNIADIASSNTPLLTLTHSNTATYKWNIAPRYNSTTLSVYPGSTETNGFRFATTGFVPASNNARYLGSASLKWKGVYTGVINNGYDIAVPVTNSADTFALESEITDINGKIPAQASTSNQLADKNFVNSSIATNTANFIGTFNSVADLEAYSGTVTNNDYAFVIGTDSAGNTTYNRYKYNGTTQQWVYEYTLNNSSFTAVQWASINSGVTASDVSKARSAVQPSDLGNGTITITQGGISKGTFTTNQSGNTTIALDAGGGSAGQAIDAIMHVSGGNPAINGSIVSGFGNSSYLELPGVFKLGASDTRSFEINCVFTTQATEDTNKKVILVGYVPNQIVDINLGGVSIRYGGYVGQKIEVLINSANSTQTITGTTDLLPATKYYVKIEYDGTNYKLWLSTDGSAYTLETSDARTVLPAPAKFCIGRNFYHIESVDMSGWDISKNGQMVWAGMDAPGLCQRVATGHEVIAFQAPTASNNYTWYRKYADGWVEQGGHIDTAPASEETTVVFPVTMADTTYFATRTIEGSINQTEWTVYAGGCVYNKTTTGMTFRLKTPVCWEVKGMA